MVLLQDQADIKQQLAAVGVNSRGWRLYVDYGYAMFLPLGQRWCDIDCHDVRGKNEVAWLKILQACEMDVLPPPQLVESIAHWHIPGKHLDVVPPLFLRLAWKACVAAQYQEDGIEDFIEQELIPLAKWFFLSRSYQTVDIHQLKAGWNCMLRLRREYVAELTKVMGADDWPPVLRRYESGPFTMSALSYAHQLVEEGDAMEHCVGDYEDRCRFEPLRIFSVRYKKTGQRVATLSLLEKSPGVWDFDQLKGPKNADVDLRVWQEADGLVQLMNRVSVTDIKARQFLDFIHSLGSVNAA
jgi:hypothetical protein